MKGVLGTFMRCRRAMTLVELMVVVGLIALLMTLMAVRVRSAPYRLKSSVAQLRSLIQRARLEAVKSNRNVYVDFDAEDDGVLDTVVLWVQGEAREASPVYDPGDDTAWVVERLFNPPGAVGGAADPGRCALVPGRPDNGRAARRGRPSRGWC